MLPVICISFDSAQQIVSMRNAPTPDAAVWLVRWLYKTDSANAKLWFDVGRTRVFQEHVNALMVSNASDRPLREPTRCRWLFPSVARLAREANLTSIQFTRHTMDRFRPRPRYEIVDLQRPWRPWRDNQSLGPPYYASARHLPCARS